jgi:uncharacterized RDD family membrane protein YckC
MDLLSDLIEKPRLAPLKYRIGASIIDILIVSVIFAVMGHYFGESYTEGNAAGVRITGFPAFVLFAILFVLMPIQEGLTGRTIGKRVAGIKVMKEDFSDGTVGTSIVRHLFDGVDLFFCIGLIVANSSQKKQRVGDLVAKTVVVMN